MLLRAAAGRLDGRRKVSPRAEGLGGLNNGSHICAVISPLRTGIRPCRLPEVYLSHRHPRPLTRVDWLENLQRRDWNGAWIHKASRSGPAGRKPFSLSTGPRRRRSVCIAGCVLTIQCRDGNIPAPSLEAEVKRAERSEIQRKREEGISVGRTLYL